MPRPDKSDTALAEKVYRAVSAFKENSERQAVQREHPIDKVNVGTMMDEMRAGLKSLQFRLEYSALATDAKHDYLEIKPFVIEH